MAGWINNLLAVEFYGSPDTLDSYPPNIADAWYDPFTREVRLAFENTESLIWPDDTLGQRLEDYFYLDGDWGVVDTAIVVVDTIRLRLTGPHFFDHITYLPEKQYNTIQATYQGPWLRNAQGIAALSFYQYPIVNPEKTIKVTAPNGGEVWVPGTEQAIAWVQMGVDTVDIAYSDDNGATWQTVMTGVAASPGSYSWTTPAISSTECLLRITDAANDIIADQSNGVFGIYAKSVTVLVPNGGESWAVGSSQTVAWSSSFVDQLYIQYSTDGGASWSTVARAVTAADGQRGWVIPDEVSTSCLVKIRDMSDPSVTDTSDAVFAIVSTTGTEDYALALPRELALGQNQPNPFNPVTEIEYSLPKRSRVELVICDLAGKVVTRLVGGEQAAGRYAVRWEGLDARGQRMPSGIYIYQLRAAGEIKTRKMVLLR
jgi:hypothetical protein